MDKKILSKLFLYSLSGALLVGCGNQAEETPEEAEEPETDITETPEEDATETEETEEATDTEDAADEVSFTIDILVDGETVADLSKEVDRKSTRLNSSHVSISYAVFCLKKKIQDQTTNHCVDV